MVVLIPSQAPLATFALCQLGQEATFFVSWKAKDVAGGECATRRRLAKRVPGSQVTLRLVKVRQATRALGVLKTKNGGALVGFLFGSVYAFAS